MVRLCSSVLSSRLEIEVMNADSAHLSRAMRVETRRAAEPFGASLVHLDAEPPSPKP